MTQENKQLLLKDLCGRLSYGVKILDIPANVVGDLFLISTTDTVEYETNDDTGCQTLYNIKPYLRPMESMTEEERDEWMEITHAQEWLIIGNLDKATDWLNAHHFDYRGLIPMDLALEAPEGTYNKEESEKGSKIPIPKTVDEAISTLEKILSDEDREYLLKNGAISMHHSLGRWIRNEWGLWTGSELKNELKKKRFEHPDDMSNYIIKEFIKYWNNKNE